MVAYIPVSDWSVRCPHKNYRTLAGEEVWRWTYRAALDSRCFQQVVVLARGEELILPTIRFKSRTPADRLGNAWEAVSCHVTSGDICLLLPTSPFRNSQHIVEACARRGERIASVAEIEMRTARELRAHDGQTQIGHLPTSLQLYRSTGGIQIWNDYDGTVDFWSRPVVPFVLPMPAALDIDTEEDWALAEYYADRLP